MFSFPTISLDNGLMFMFYFSQRFIQYLASRTSLFNLSNFIDKTGSHGNKISKYLTNYIANECVQATEISFFNTKKTALLFISGRKAK